MEWITPRTKWTRQRPEWSRPDYARIMSVGGKFSSFLFPSTVWNAAKFNFNIKRTPSSIRGTGHNVERIHIFSPVTAKVVTQFSCRCHISKVSSNIKSSNLLFHGNNNDFLAAKYCVWLAWFEDAYMSREIVSMIAFVYHLIISNNIMEFKYDTNEIFH